MAAAPRPDSIVDFAKSIHAAAKPRNVQHLANLGAFGNMAYTVAEQPVSMSYSAIDITGSR